MSFNLLRVFINKLNESYVNLNELYEFECEKTAVTSFKEDDFVLPKFDLKLELADRTVSDHVEEIFDSLDTFR